MTRPMGGGDPEVADRVRELTKVGRSAPEIAAMLRISSRTVLRYRHRVGLANPPTGRMTAEQLAWAEQLLDDGCSGAEVARTVGVAPSTILRRFPGRRWSHDECGSYAAFCARAARGEL